MPPKLVIPEFPQHRPSQQPFSLTSSDISIHLPESSAPRLSPPSTPQESAALLLPPPKRLLLLLPPVPIAMSTSLTTVSAHHPNISALESLISYTFTNRLLAQEALTAPGALINGPHFPDGNKRLAVVGDIALDLALAGPWFNSGTGRGKSTLMITIRRLHDTKFVEWHGLNKTYVISFLVTYQVFILSVALS